MKTTLSETQWIMMNQTANPVPLCAPLEVGAMFLAEGLQVNSSLTRISLAQGCPAPQLGPLGL